MSMSHNQMAYAAIISTLIFGSLFVGTTGFFQTSEGAGDYDSAVDDDLIGSGTDPTVSIDSDNDGLPDRLEAQFGTDPNDEDTDKDGMLDGWEVQNGLNPLDNGESEILKMIRRMQILKMLKFKKRPIPGQIQMMDLVVTQIEMV